MTEIRYIEVTPRTIEEIGAFWDRLVWGTTYEVMLGVSGKTALMLLDTADELASSRVMTLDQARRTVMRQALRAINAQRGAPGILGACR